MIKNKLLERKGSMSILTIIIVLAMFLMITGIAEYFRFKNFASHVRDAVQSAVINTSIENYENVYSSNRESYTSGHLYKGGSWKLALDNGDIMNQVANVLGLNDSYEKYSEEKLEYKISNLKIDIKSPPLRVNKTNKFIVTSTIDLEMPFGFGWDLLPLKIPLTVKSEYMPLF